jgi:hypothetical protein
MPDTFKRIVLSALLCMFAITASAPAHATDLPDPVAPRVADPADPERPAAEASGLIEPRDPEEAPGRQVARIALLPLRVVWFVVWAPVRAVLWSYDRFAVSSRFKAFFFSEDGRVGVFPVAIYKTGFGPTGGARIQVRDLIKAGSRLTLEVFYGGEFVQAYRARYRTGRGPFELDLRSDFETFPRSRFFGIGNGDLTTMLATIPIDPLRDPTAVDTRFYYDAFTTDLRLAIDLPGPARVRPRFGYRLRDFDRDETLERDESTLEVYDSAGLVGFDTGLSTLIGELELVIDTIRQPRFYLTSAMPSTGWHLSLRAGYYRGLGDDPSRHLRWGMDVQRYFDLYGGDRVLVLRAVYEGVTGSLANVPFVDLPRLGGPAVLRGYPQDRFRDRQAGVATVEYQWGIDRSVGAFVFSDVGRVWRNYDDLKQGNLRVAFGGGLQLHTMKNFLGRLMIASSIDGDLFVQIGLDPLFERQRMPL